MTAPEVRAQLADLAADAARIAAAVEAIGPVADFAGLIADVARFKYREGHEDGRAERDPYAAEARARRLRSQFRVIPGGAA